MTLSAVRLPTWIARAVAACAAALTLASCGGGSVSPSPNVPDQQAIVILPASTAAAPVVAYSGLPTTFSITGGNGRYIVASNNQAAIPSPGSFVGSSFTIVPSPVTTETTVTLSVRDTATAPPVTATVTVRPGTVNNEITITPTSTQGDCSPAICSGGDALVSARIAQGGIPLAARGVRFEVVSGDFRFITSAPGAATETLENSIVVVTDETGTARARLRVLPLAPNQTALLRVTDMGSGAFQQTSFAIAQASGGSPGYFALPEAVTFTGPREDQCARGASSSFFIYGGTPPYTIANTSSAFTVSPTVVTARGGSFTVVAQGSCVAVPGLPIGITDAAGRTISVSVANVPGTEPVPEFVVAPEEISLNDCNSIANFTVAGGTGNYLQPTSGSGSVMATIFGNTVSVRRINPSPPATSPVNIGVSDGISVKSVVLTLTGRGLGACPSGDMVASPAAVSLTDCTTATLVSVSGGSGIYTATSSSSSISATVSGNTVTIRRVSPSAAFASGTVTVSDGVSSVGIAVTATGEGAGICPVPTPPAPLSANPTSVTLLDCSASQAVTLSGGTGSYSFVASHNTIAANITGTTLTIQRAKPSDPQPTPASVTVSNSDASGSPVSITVNFAGAGALACAAT